MTLGLLPASLAALASGPLIARVADDRPGVLVFLDGFVLVTISGLVMLEVVPYTLLTRDLWVIPCLMLGFALPSFAERQFQSGVARTHIVVIAMSLLGLTLHSALDGSELARTADGPSALLGVAVLLHQLPVSLLIWIVLHDRPRAFTWLLLSAMAIATVGGYLLEPAILTLLPSRAGEWLSALVGGSLLHVVLHPSRVTRRLAQTVGAPALASRRRSEQRTAFASGLGALVALSTLVALEILRGDPAGTTVVSALWDSLRALAVISAPVILVAYVAGAIIALFATTPPTATVPGADHIGSDTRARLQSEVAALVDRTAPWLLLGLIVSSIVAPSLHRVLVALPVAHPASHPAAATPLQLVALIGLAVLFTSSLLRRGARGFFAARQPSRV